MWHDFQFKYTITVVGKTLRLSAGIVLWKNQFGVHFKYVVENEWSRKTTSGIVGQRESFHINSRLEEEGRNGSIWE